MKQLALLIWQLAPLEKGLRNCLPLDVEGKNTVWLERKLMLGLPIWQAIRDYAVGNTVCYRVASVLKDRINRDSYGKARFHF